MLPNMITVWTIGHGSRSINELIDLLHDAEITLLLDVRAFPASNRHPQFSKEFLETTLSAKGIRYQWEGKHLGGFRKPLVNSANIALESKSFRGYADHMGSSEFKCAITRLMNLVSATFVSIMCAERAPSQCHRSLISDYLSAHGVRVIHLIDHQKIELHRSSPLARKQGDALIYDQTQQYNLGFS